MESVNDSDSEGGYKIVGGELAAIVSGKVE
jgi:hypothetical protein